MSRILRRKSTSLDYSLWSSVSGHSLLLDRTDSKYLADRDRGGSVESDYWKKKGRNRSPDDEVKVYDFVSLSRSFDDWFTRVHLEPEKLKEEIQNHVMGIEGSQTYFEGVEEDWLQFDWGTLGRVIGAAVANIGSDKGWWRTKGSDANWSMRFWADIHRNVDLQDRLKGIPESVWDNDSQFFRERKLDPNSEILRAFSHRPSSPFLRTQSDFGVLYFPNPLALKHRKTFSTTFNDDKELKELSKSHGKLTLECIKKAIIQLKRGKYAEFAVAMHGVCAYHIMRTSVIQQKIGLHLLTNLAIRKKTRSVGAQNVPDIAYTLATSFPLGKVLGILHNSKLIDWYTVDKEIVDEALKSLS